MAKEQKERETRQRRTLADRVAKVNAVIATFERRLEAAKSRRDALLLDAEREAKNRLREVERARVFPQEQMAGVHPDAPAE